MQLTEDTEFSAVIIGGGLGGLTAGAMLARAGKKVLLVERNPTVGGCARVVPGKGFSYEFSLHQLFGMEQGNLLRDVFNEFGLFERVEFIHLPNFYRAAMAGADVTLPYGLDQAAAVLKRNFPREEKGIRTFFRLLAAVNREVNRWVRSGCDSKLLLPLYPMLYPNMVRYANKTQGEYLDAVFQDDQLKLVLSALLPWYHDDPYATSLLNFAYGHSCCFIGGGYYIKGGSQKLSDELGRIIVDHGGTLLVSHSVKKIIIRNERACGVVCQSNHEDSGEARKFFADCVIANAAVPHVAKDLLPAPINQKLLAQVRTKIASISFLSVDLKFRRSLAELGNRVYTTVVGHPRHTRLAHFVDATRTSDYAIKGFAFTDYSIIDNGLAGGGRYAGVITLPDSIAQWEGLSQDAYSAKKEMAATILINRLNELVPGIKEEIEAHEVVTPRTIYDQTNNPGGTPYGFAMIPQQGGIRMLRYEAPIPGLYFASAWVRPGAGFIGAICGGYNCAWQVLKRLR